jgi:hypothetical protein
MRNEAWREMDLTYTEKSGEKYFLDKNCGPQLLKLRTVILGLVQPVTKMTRTTDSNSQNCGPQLMELEAPTRVLKVIIDWN